MKKSLRNLKSKQSKTLILFTIIISFSFMTGDKPAYRLFDIAGKEIKYSKMLDKLKKADIILFGELHNNPICHWLEYEVLKDLHSENKNIIAGAEMFETDTQLMIDEYLKGIITSRSFESQMRLWSNYSTDYKPLIEYSKENNIMFFATNIPRRYANYVYREGLPALSKLSDESLENIPPLPIEYSKELDCYWSMTSHNSVHEETTFLADAQAVKDATMAYIILDNFSKGKIFLHFNGTYHSDNHEGIVWFLKKQTPSLNIVTISTVTQKNIDKFSDENLEKADFILAIPESMSKSY